MQAENRPLLSIREAQRRLEREVPSHLPPIWCGQLMPYLEPELETVPGTVLNAVRLDDLAKLMKRLCAPNARPPWLTALSI